MLRGSDVCTAMSNVEAKERTAWGKAWLSQGLDGWMCVTVKVAWNAAYGGEAAQAGSRGQGWHLAYLLFLSTSAVLCSGPEASFLFLT